MTTRTKSPKRHFLRSLKTPGQTGFEEDELTNNLNAVIEAHDSEAAELYRFIHTQGAISKNVLTAVKRAEKSHVVRRELKQFDHRVLKAQVHSASSQDEKAKEGYTDLQLGYEKLKLMPMVEVDVNNKSIQDKTTQVQAQIVIPESFARNEILKTQTQTIGNAFHSIADDIAHCSWLSQEEAQDMKNIFVSELARRYHDTSNLKCPDFTPFQNRMLAIRIFEKLGIIKDSVLEKCRRKRAKMDHLDIFNKALNSERTKATFRTELAKRINPEKILRIAIHETMSGRLWVRQGPVKQHISKHEAQFKDELEAVIGPSVKVEPVQFKYLAEVIQQKINAEQEAKFKAKFEAVQLIKQKQTNVDFLMEFRRFGLQQQYLLQQRRIDMQASEKTDQATGARMSSIQRARTPSMDVSAAARIVKPRLEKMAEGEEDPMLERFKEIELERSIFYPERSSLKDEYSSMVRDDPLLQAHTANEAIANLRVRDRRIEIKPASRYLNRKRDRRADLQFDFRILDDMCANNPDYDFMDIENKGISSENLNMRLSDAKVSDRIPKGFISLTEQPVNTIHEQDGNEADTKESQLDEKLSRFKEVEELYDEIMKTIGVNEMDTEEAEEEDVVHCPTAPNDPELIMGNGYMGLTQHVDRDTMKYIPPGVAEEDLLEEEKARLEEEQARLARAQAQPQKLVRMTTRDEGQKAMNADEFAKHRDAAMKKVTSSKYGAFKYNYGGYIPQSIIRKKIEEEQKITFKLADYISHLRIYQSDFILDILVDEDAEEEARRQADEARKQRKLQEQERIRQEEELNRKIEERKKMLEFMDGMWNPGVMDYLAEIHLREQAQRRQQASPTLQRRQSVHPEGLKEAEKTLSESENTVERRASVMDGVSVPGSRAERRASILMAMEEGMGEQGRLSISGGKSDRRNSSLLQTPLTTLKTPTTTLLEEEAPELSEEAPVTDSVQQENIPHAIGSLEHLAEELTRLGTQQSSILSAESLVDTSKAQQELEALWTTLQMPLDQKLDMAIKYGGGAKYAAKLDMALMLWRSTAKLILEREELLIKCEIFERTATDPDRFFRKGYEGSSEARMEEASKRDDLLRKLHSIEARITDNVNTIKNELRETVTYKGAPYLLKMRCDYLDIIERIQKDREMGLLPSQNRPPSAPKTKSRNASQKAKQNTHTKRKTMSASSSSGKKKGPHVLPPVYVKAPEEQALAKKNRLRTRSEDVQSSSKPKPERERSKSHDSRYKR